MMMSLVRHRCALVFTSATFVPVNSLIFCNGGYISWMGIRRDAALQDAGKL